MGLFSSPKPAAQLPVEETPKEVDVPLASGLEDPDAFNNSRKRAEDAKRRLARSSLRIPLSSTLDASTGSGLQIS